MNPTTRLWGNRGSEGSDVRNDGRCLRGSHVGPGVHPSECRGGNNGGSNHPTTRSNEFGGGVGLSLSKFVSNSHNGIN